MRIYVAHFHADDTAKAGATPIMVKEGFSWPCLILGWIGLLLSGAWVAALLAGAASIVLAVLLRPFAGIWPAFAGLQLLLGLFGNDLRAWELRLHGLVPGPVVAAADADAALARLIDQRPELLGGST